MRTSLTRYYKRNNYINNNTMDIAIYARVSTKQQQTDRQVYELTDYANKQGYTVAATYLEVISRAKSNKERAVLTAMLAEAKEGRFKKVLVSEISRLGGNTAEVLAAIEELNALGVSVYCLNYNLETLDAKGKPNPVASLIITILAEFAKLERSTLIDRINSGLAEARRKGTVLGRRKGSTKDVATFLGENKRIVGLLKEGHSIRNAATLASVAPKTVMKVKKLMSKV
jgi:DNA invertase Pin-like site-specific DNA recombinase